MTYYKALHGIRSKGVGTAPVITYRKGRWTTRVKPRLCESGYHVCEASSLIEHLDIGDTVYEFETRGVSVVGDDKIACESAKRGHKAGVYTEKVARLFACDCAEACLHLFEAERPDDKRPRVAIETARRFANGAATAGEMAAAWAAARDAARDAAGAAARAAAWDAAWAATWDAAWAATGAAARAAARAAAWDAAWAATGAAARAAAWAAARKNQGDMLIARLETTP